MKKSTSSSSPASCHREAPLLTSCPPVSLLISRLAHGAVLEPGTLRLLHRLLHSLTNLVSLLTVPQERVWKQEKAALEERKRTADLQKELAQERAVQELQRLQEEAGGKKREQRVDWMYAAPAEGNGPNAEELEQYLLGKKRVDQLLKGNEEKVSSMLGLYWRVCVCWTCSLTIAVFASCSPLRAAHGRSYRIRSRRILHLSTKRQLCS